MIDAAGELDVPNPRAGCVSRQSDEEHVLDILPTGAGKSLCYQVLALSREDKTGALTWTFRIASGVSEGIDKSVVQSDWEFPYVGLGDRH